MARVLIVDDEPRIRDLIREHLQYAGFTCAEAGDGTQALAELANGGIDLVILDIMMPFMDGMTCLREMRTRKIMTPVIMLTARSEDADKIIGLESGADDYITKPFNILELKARIRALLRRANAAPQQKQPETLLLTAGGITLDPEQRVAVKNGEIVELTAKEYDLIELLVKNPRRVYSRENLMDLVWGYMTKSQNFLSCPYFRKPSYLQPPVGIRRISLSCNRYRSILSNSTVLHGSSIFRAKRYSSSKR